jgi:hypothetical protein
MAMEKTRRRLTVVEAEHAWECERCSQPGDFFLRGKTGGVCLDCADLGHLEFLPSGDAALSRRAREASRVSAVVMRWNLRRGRYERRGLLAEPAGIEQAARECLSDLGFQERRSVPKTRRAVEDLRFEGELGAAIREQFPGCPPDRAAAIALHVTARSSGVAARKVDSDAVRVAVAASVRHVDTDYDELLLSGVDRDAARATVSDRVESVLSAWQDGYAALDA